MSAADAFDDVARGVREEAYKRGFDAGMAHLANQLEVMSRANAVLREALGNERRLMVERAGEEFCSCNTREEPCADCYALGSALGRIDEALARTDSTAWLHERMREFGLRAARRAHNDDGSWVLDEEGDEVLDIDAIVDEELKKTLPEVAS